MTLEQEVKSFLRIATTATIITIGANYINYYITKNSLRNHEEKNGKDSTAELSVRILQDDDIFEYPIIFGKKSAAREYLKNYIINVIQETPKKQEKNTYRGNRHFVIM